MIFLTGSHLIVSVTENDFCLSRYVVLTTLPGPNELPLFLEGDEELTALAQESAGTAQGLATQLSAVRRSQMSCWGIADDKRAEVNGSSRNGCVGTNGESESDGAAVAMVTDDHEEGREGSNGEAAAARDHRSCMGWWEGVLGRWHERTQLVDPSLQKKFRVVNQGPWAQITASLADRERANRRAFMTESEVSICLSARTLGDVWFTFRQCVGTFVLYDDKSCPCM